MSKRSVVSNILFASAGLLLVSNRAWKRHRKPSATVSPNTLSQNGSGAIESASQNGAFDRDEATRNYLSKVMLPALIVPGLLDWVWHKQTKIETTAGPKESLFHLAMMAENGALLLAGLLLEMNAGAIALMAGLSIAHQATAMWDVSSTISVRKIYPREQHTHSLMESIPFFITSFAVCLHPNQFLALFGAGPEKAELPLKLKDPPLSLREMVLIFGALGGLGGVPLLEEYWRCLKAQRQGLIGTDTPPCAHELYDE